MKLLKVKGLSLQQDPIQQVCSKLDTKIVEGVKLFFLGLVSQVIESCSPTEVLKVGGKIRHKLISEKRDRRLC